MKLKDLIQKTDLDWSRLIAQLDGHFIGLSKEFSLTPKDFLAFAKKDFYSADARGLVNALSNAKRAIDCQTDLVLLTLGFTPNALVKQLGKSRIGTFQSENNNKNQPLKFKALESLGMVTPSIINRIRNIRNLLEHEYKKPTQKHVSDAIDVAVLYVKACQGMLNSFVSSAIIGSGVIAKDNEERLEKQLHIDFENFEKHVIQVSFWNLTTTIQSRKIRFTPDDFEYFPLLKIIFSINLQEGTESAVATLLAETGVSIGKKKVKVIEYGYT